MKLFHKDKRRKKTRQKERLRAQFTGFTEHLQLQGFSMNTINTYLHYVDTFIRFVKKQAKFVTSSDVKAFLVNELNRNQKERTRNVALSALKSYFDDYCGRHLFFKIKRAKVPKSLPQYVVKEQVQAMIKHTRSDKHKLMIYLMFETGLRVGECVSVKVGHIHEVARLLFVYRGKGKKDRYVPLQEGLYHEIKQYLALRKRDSIYLFENSFGGHLTIKTAQVIVDIAAKRAGLHLHVHPHMFRAGFVVGMMQNGVEVWKIQKMMGHASRDTTLGYAARMPHDLDARSIPSLMG